MLWQLKYQRIQEKIHSIFSLLLLKSLFTSVRMMLNGRQTLSSSPASGTLSNGSGNSLPQMNSRPLNSAWRTASTWDNSEAQIAVIFFFFLAIAFVAFYWMMLSSIMDTGTIISNNLTASGSVPMSSGRQESMLELQGAFSSVPILAFIFFIIAAIIVALASKYSTV